jgi:predicted  nucleic acid-binding Zn-ribbon protein
MKNTIEVVKEKMSDMIRTKRQELRKLNTKLEELRAELKGAEDEIRHATTEMNLEAYEEAEAKKKKAALAISMYEGKLKQLSKQEYISEEESDKIIDSILDYEEEITKQFEADIAEPLNTLLELAIAYQNTVEDAENTIKEWTGHIHANYSTRGLTSKIDPRTGQYTDRSDTPVPVHPTPYTGSPAANIIIQAIQRGTMKEYAK